MDLPPARAWSAIALIIVLAAVLVAAWPALGGPYGTALGRPTGEGAAHLWGLWTSAEGLWAEGPYVRVAAVAWPDGWRADLADPIHLLVFVPALWIGLGPALAWNLVVVSTIALAGVGGWRLGGRLWPGSPAPRLLLTAALVSAPALHGALPLGRSEYLPGAWIALPLSLLWEALQPGAGRGRAALAILGMVLLGHAGPQLVLGLLIFGMPLLVKSWLCGTRAARVRLGWVLGLSVLGLLPRLWSLVEVEPWWLQRLASPVLLPDPSQCRSPFALLRYWPIEVQGHELEVPAYAGLALVLGAALSLSLSPRRVAPWLGLGLGFLAVCLGPRWVLGGSTDLLGPAALLQALPPLRAFHGWSRWMILLSLPFGLAIGHGVHRLGGHRPRLGAAIALGVSALLMLDGLSWRPVEPAAFSLRPPPLLEAALGRLPAGPLLELPVRQGDAVAERRSEDASLLWARACGRPTQLAPSPAESSVERSNLLMRLPMELDRLQRDPCLSRSVAALMDLGFVGLVFHLDRAPANRRQASLELLQGLLGPAISGGDPERPVWALSVPPGSACAEAVPG